LPGGLGPAGYVEPIRDQQSLRVSLICCKLDVHVMLGCWQTLPALDFCRNAGIDMEPAAWSDAPFAVGAAEDVAIRAENLPVRRRRCPSRARLSDVCFGFVLSVSRLLLYLPVIFLFVHICKTRRTRSSRRDGSVRTMTYTTYTWESGSVRQGRRVTDECGSVRCFIEYILFRKWHVSGYIYNNSVGGERNDDTRAGDLSPIFSTAQQRRSFEWIEP